MSKLDIAIAGEINLDLILYGLPEQMPTERELLASGFTITLGSSSAILAHNLAALGSRVGFVTKVGATILSETCRWSACVSAEWTSPASRMAPSPA